MISAICSLLAWSALGCIVPPATHTFSAAPAIVAQLGLPVSLANVGDGDYLIADYQHVFLFNRQTNRLAELQIDMGESKSKFVPTSFAADHDRIFIANYLGNNILIARLDKPSRTLRITGQIGDDKTISPEGVAFDGTMLATANFDGRTVQVFTPQGDGWTTRCTVPVDQAHGVALLAGNVYATSLTDRQLVKIDPRSCQEVARSGTPGWEKGQYLWPTSINAFDDKSLIVSDAHTGMLTVVDAEKLEPIRQFGGNGPGITNLNMPYGTLVEGPEVLVTDTFRTRIVAFDKASGAMTTSWSTRPIWQSTPADMRQATLAAQARSGPYTRTSVSVTLDGQCYHPDYARLVRCDDPAKSVATRGVNGILYYMVEAVRLDHGVMVFSPQAPYATYIRDNSDPTKPETAEIGRDCWLVDGKVTCPDGPISAPVNFR
ncbi:hypothetical protein ACQPTN_32065 [Bradyrhizobium sp. 13971]|uniref:hypothetical protein n=1 Tax=Bradyrhizobium elkanii TaxID=29448 RepID=UPI00114D249B|nr:hypothetical protein [Bradyrhizobium elkanii]